MRSSKLKLSIILSLGMVVGMFAAACGSSDSNPAVTPDSGVLPDGATIQPGCYNLTAEARAKCAQTLAARFDADTTIAKGCYVATKTPVLAAGVTLTLSPGVTIIFSKDTALDIGEGQALVAAGTALEPICLTGASTTAGSWKGVKFEMTTEAKNNLEYVTVEYAGNTAADKDAAAVKVTSDSRGVALSMSHSLIRHSQGWGIYVVGSATVAKFEANNLTLNTLGPASLDAEIVRMLDSASTYKMNTVDQINVRGGTVKTKAKWAAIDVPYFINGAVEIGQVAGQSDMNLTLEAPATFIMGTNAGFEISDDSASLTAVGTAEKAILFTGKEKTRGYWQGITFTNTNNSNNKLAYATVEYAGGMPSTTPGDVVLTSTGTPVNLSIHHCTLKESKGFGLVYDGNGVLADWNANVLTKNAKGPVWTHSKGAHQLLANSTYTGNDIDAVAINANHVGAVTWAAIGVPYVFTGNLQVDAVWNIDPGVTIKLPEKGWISIDGDDSALHAVGTAAKPIVFTGTTATKGFWNGILFGNTNNSSNILDYVTVEYGGAQLVEKGAITATCDSHGVTLTVSHSTIQHNAQYGIWVCKPAVLNSDVQSSNTFSDNTSGNFYRVP